MYQPPHLVETDLGVLHALIRAHPLGLLISAGKEARSPTRCRSCSTPASGRMAGCACI